MSAQEQYKKEQEVITGLLNQIKGQLNRHESDFKNERNGAADWGYVGDLNQVKKDLENITEFLANSL